ncbi:hypothetical protein [Kaarinaea lacus]
MFRDFFHCYRTHCSVLFIFFSFYLFSASAIAVDDTYLDALEAEAESSAHFNENGSAIDDQKKSEGGLKLNKKEMMRFETELKSARPATYRFYKKLDQQDKAAVFVIYKKDHKMTHASKTVFDLYFEKNK